MPETHQKIMPCLWFDMNCQEALDLYTSIFPNSKINTIMHYPEGYTEGPLSGMSGKIWTVYFELDGFSFQALDGGPYFKLNPAISFMVNFDPSRDPKAAENLEEMWGKFSEGGTVLMELDEYPFSKKYGWIQDRFGVSWQLILTNPDGEPRPSIMPSLLFVGDVCGKAEEALNYYVSIFKNSKMGTVAKYPAEMEHDKEGTAMYAEAMLDGQWFVAMDSGQEHKFGFNEAVSLSVDCKDQAEVDYFWKMSTVPESEQCGWLKDKYGVSWQIVPEQLGEFLMSGDPEKIRRVTDAFMPMKKLDIAKLQEAFDGK